MTQAIGRKVAILLSGSILAQALPVLAAPLLTRIFTPEAFGQFGMFTAAAMILAAAANLKFDQAVLLAKRQATAVHLVVLCMAASVLLAGLIAGFVFLAPSSWWQAAGFDESAHFVAFLPISFLLAAMMLSVSAMFFRQEMFSAVAKARVVQAIATTGLCVGFGLWDASGSALIAASLIGQCVGLAVLLSLRAQGVGVRVKLRARLLRVCIRRYRRFAMYTAPSDVLNALGANMPVLFIGAIYGPAPAGAFAMAQRVLGTPLMLVGSAFSDTYRQAAGKNHANNGSYWDIAFKTIRTLGLLAVIPAVLCISLAPSLSPMIFGEKWAESGQVMQILGFVYFLRFVVSPLSYNYYLAERHSEDLVLQCVGFSLTLGVFVYAQRYALGFMTSLVFYATVCFTVYMIYGSRSLYFARMSLRNRMQTTKAGTAL